MRISQPLRWACSTRPDRLRRKDMPPKPIELMLTTAQLPPALRTMIMVAHHFIGIGM